MKQVTVDKKELYEILKSASSFFPKKTTMPILDTYKIEVTPSTFKVIVSNMEASIEKSIPIMGFDTFEACLDKSVLEMIGKCPSGNIVMEFFEPTGVRITAGKAVFYTQTLEHDQYPPLPETAAENSVVLKAADFERMLQAVEFATASDDCSRKVLTAVNFVLKDGKMTLTAIDGNRVATQSMSVETNGVEINMNIPRMSKFIRSMDSKDDIKVSWDSSNVIITSQDCKVVCRLIEGAFMDIGQILKCDKSSIVTVSRKSLLESLERASLIAKTNGAKKPVIMELSDEILTLQMEETKGKFEETMLVQKEGKDIRTGFKTSYLIDALAKIVEDRVRLLFAGSKLPLTIRSDDAQKEDDYAYVVMPVNVR